MAIHKVGKELAVKWIKRKSKEFLRLAFLRLENSYWWHTDEIKWAFTIKVDSGINEWHQLVMPL